MSKDGAAQRRHPEEGGYARGEETRARIIAAALQIFGEHGYDQASTRQIAASAGVNPPALQYYFGGKEGLHRACAQHIIDRMLVVLEPALAQAGSTVRGGPAQAVEALCNLLDAMLDVLVIKDSVSWSRFVARGKTDEVGPAMDMLHEQIGVRLRGAVTRLVGLAIGSPARSETVQLKAIVILGQVAHFYHNREHIQAVMGWKSFEGRVLAQVKAVVREHTRAVLGGVARASGPVAVPGSRARASR